MDAYSSYILRLSEARTSELRRESAEYALARAARGQRTSWWARARARLAARRGRAAEAVAPVALPRPAEQAELRRSA